MVLTGITGFMGAIHGAIGGDHHFLMAVNGQHTPQWTPPADGLNGLSRELWGENTGLGTPFFKGHPTEGIKVVKAHVGLHGFFHMGQKV